MSINKSRSLFNAVFSMIGSAIALASTAQQSRQNSASELRRLGLNPAQYRAYR